MVTVSSGAHRFGRMDFDDLQSARSYQKWRVYGQSKLANILFALELHRRADEAAGADLRSIAVHPGYAATNLQSVGPQMSGSRVGASMMALANRVLAQSGRGRGVADADGGHRSERSQRHLHRADGLHGRSAGRPVSRPRRRPRGTSIQPAASGM